MEVAIPVTAGDFEFGSNCSTPYVSAPSSPKRFGEFFYFSAPTSPSRSASIYKDFNRLSVDNHARACSSSAIPFDWEEKPGTPKSKEADANATEEDESYDFEFDFSGQLEKAPVTAAEELFEKGKIRPLKPPPRLQVEEFTSARSSPKSPKSPKRMFRGSFSPKGKKDFDPFEAAIQETRKGSERGRERLPAPYTSNPSRRAARSLSPYRDSDLLEQNSKPSSKNSQSQNASLKANSKKWSFKDFLLFRSASEGRATDKDPLRKYRVLTKKAEDVKNSSFRSTDSSGSNRGKKGPVSAHELHYTANRAASEDMRKKTFLPYRQGLLGCLGFNPTVHGLAKGFNSVTRV